MPNVVHRPKVNAIIASTATIDDFFPKTMALDIGVEGRPFTVVGRRLPDGRPADPDLIVVSNDGVLHRLRPSVGSAEDWSEETFALPELRGGIVMAINASAQDPDTGSERLIVTITAQTADRLRVFYILQRTPEKGWERFRLPPSPFNEKDLSMATASGFAGLGAGKLQTFYACFPPEAGLGSLAAYGVSNAGQAFTVAFMDNPRGIDRLVSLGADGQLALARLENNVLTLYPGRIEGNPASGVMPAHFDMGDRRRSMPMPLPVEPKDASCMYPVMDTRSLCHGMFIRTAANGAIACSFADDESDATGVLTGHADGPADAIDIAGSFDEDGNVHVFLVDSEHLIWYAHWRKGTAAEALVWEPSGQLAANIEAPSIGSGLARVLSAGADDTIFQTVRTGSSGEWARTGIAIPDPKPEAVASTVHAVTISTVTAQSEAVADTPVRIRASEPTVVEHAGRLYRLGPDRPLDLITGRTGGIMLRLRANGISSPELLVSSPALPMVPEHAYRPQEAALSRLAGHDPDFPVTGKNIRAAGIVPANLNDADADKIANAIRDSARKALTGTTSAPMGPHRRSFAAATAPRAGLSVRITRTGSGLEVEQTSSAADVRFSTRGLADATSLQTAQAESSGGFWSFLRTAWETVKTFVVEVVETGVKFVVETANKIVEWVTDAAHYIAQGIEALISWLSDLGSGLWDAGRKVIAWVAEKLGWSDVVRAKTLMRDYLLASMADLQTVIGEALPAKISEGIAFARSRVESAFDTAMGHLAPLSESDQQKVVADPARGTFSQNSSKTLLIQNAVPEDDGGYELFPVSDALLAKFRQLGERAQEIGDQAQFRNLLEPLARFFDGKTELGQALALGLRDLLSLLKPLVLFGLDLVDTLQTLLFEIVAAVIGHIRTAMSTPITALGSAFNWVNMIYKNISGGEELTFIDLACLLFVAPGAILHHIIKGEPLVGPPGDGEAANTPTTSPLAFTGAALSPNPDATKAKDAAHRALDTAGTVQAIFGICIGVWALIRSVSSLVEDGNRVANMENAEIPGASIWGAICSVVDYALVPLLSFAIPVLQAFFALSDDARGAISMALFAAGMVGAFVACYVALCWDTIKAWIAAIPKMVMVVGQSIISFFLGVIKLVFHFAYATYWWIQKLPSASAGETLRFHLGLVGKVFTDVRGITGPMLPVGYLMTKSGAGPVAIAGAVLLGVSFPLDSLTYLTYGATGIFSNIHELADGA